MFERYTDHALRCVQLAREAVSTFGNPPITREHLLWGIIEDRSAFNRELITKVTTSVGNLRSEIEAGMVFLERVGPRKQVPFTPASKRVIQFTEEEAERLSDKNITAGHLLVGLLRDRTPPVDVLTRHGLTLSSVREALHRSKGAVEHALVRVIDDITPALLKSLRRKPEQLRTITREKFEHLAAERLTRMASR